VIGVCVQIDPMDRRRRHWVVRVSVSECGDGSVLMWLRRVQRGPCGGCGQYARVLLVPEEPSDESDDTRGRCRGCVVALVLQLFREEAMNGATA
jgi:hypothetical protein